MTEEDRRRRLPQVDALARSAPESTPYPLALVAARRVIATARKDLARSGAGSLPDLVAALSDELATCAPMRAVINATGVLLHTNLGRAPGAALTTDASVGASDVELDLETGERGRRFANLEASLCALTGSEAALVVNNNAAAMLLALSALAAPGEVVVSRGQLVEIGGSFRIPDIIVQGGARLHEVGTTNRTRVDDYRSAITEATALLLEVHPSNYRVSGFTESVPTRMLAELARSHGVPLVVDLGSGLLDARCPWLGGDPPAWLAREPAARQTLEAGADVVAFSGDKLLGGPQAGIACGRAELIEQMRRHPLARALRYDRVRAHHLQETLCAYLEATAGDEIPFWRMATASLGALRDRAATIAAMLPDHADLRVVDVTDAAGAGSAPTEAIPGLGLAIRPQDRAADLCGRLRRGYPPVLAIIREDEVVLHLRSVDPSEDERLGRALEAAVAVQ